MAQDSRRDDMQDMRGSEAQLDPPDMHLPGEPHIPNEDGRRRWPPLLRFLGLSMALGIAAGIGLASVLVLVNAGGIKDLMAGDRQTYFVLALLNILLALTGGSVAMGIAVMTLPFDRDAEPPPLPDPDSDRPA